MEAKFNSRLKECRTEQELADVLLSCVPIIREYTADVDEEQTVHNVLNLKMASRKGV